MGRDMGAIKGRRDRFATVRDHPVAKARGFRERAAGLHATAARFDAPSRRIVLELTSGYSFGIPIARLLEIRNEPDGELRKVAIIGAGTILHWESLDADY